MNFDLVNFIDNNEKSNKNIDEYDTTTTEIYRIMRLYKVDPIMNEEIPKDLIFDFKYKWNPITGERETIDEYGALCFNALNLYEYYYKNRYNELWIPPSEQYNGYYGDLLGCGTEMKINGKYCPEKYLYRLPIIDCYLKKSHNYSIITFGPKLTDEEIIQIDNLISKYINGKPNLQTLKKYYDNAINKSPDIVKLQKLYPSLSDMELKEKYNRKYVDKLIKMTKF